MSLKTNNLSKLTPWKSVIAILWEWLIIVITIYLSNYYSYPILYILSWFVIGTRMYALYSLLHESLHFLIVKNKKYNDGIASVFLAWPLFIDLKSMRKIHFEHHKYLKTEKDPESKHLLYEEFSFPLSIQKFFIISIKDLTGYNFLKYNFKGFALWLKSPMKRITDINYSRLIFYTSILLLLIYFNQINILLIFWFFPYISIYQWLNRIRLYTEHYNLKESNSQLTRTLKLNPIQRFFFAPYNLGYHEEHHHNSSVPFYNLRKLSKLLEKGKEGSETEVVNNYFLLFKYIIKK